MPKINIFYGWWIVIASMIIGIYTAGSFYYGFAFFVGPIRDEFDWTTAVIALAVGLRTMEMGIAAPAMGFLTDRFGPRRIVLAGGLVGGLGLMLLSQTHSIAEFFGAFLVMSVGFSACGSVVLTTAVANWFRTRVGLAMGLTTTGFGLGGIMVPLVSWLIENYDWRTTLIIFAIGSWIILPLCALVLRHKPEQYGYSPDGVILPAVSESESKESTEVEFTARQASKTTTFWILALATAMGFMGMNAVVTLVADHLNTRGIVEGSTKEVLVIMFIPLLSAVGRLAFGWLGDFHSKKRLLSLTILLQGIGLVIFSCAPNLAALVIFLITFGTGYGGSIALRPAIQREYFGRNSFGAIQGLTMAILTVGGIIGPLFAGLIFDWRSDYQMAWIIFAAANAMMIPFALSMKYPRKNF